MPAKVKTGQAGDGGIKPWEKVLHFWFGDPPRARSELWFGKADQSDRIIRARFGDLVECAAAGKIDAWAEEARGRLALIILLDQFPRHIWRNEARAYAFDGRAVQLVLDGLQRDHDRALAPIEQAFFYMPLEHAEDHRLQDLAVRCFSALCAQAGEDHQELFKSFLDYAWKHREIVRRFGRFPHRNRTLGRQSSEEEKEFLRRPGSSF